MNCQQKSREHAENNRSNTNFFDYFSSPEANLVHQCGNRFRFPPFIVPAGVIVMMFSLWLIPPLAGIFRSFIVVFAINVNKKIFNCISMLSSFF